jgi:hypothetical protein
MTPPPRDLRVVQVAGTKAARKLSILVGLFSLSNLPLTAQAGEEPASVPVSGQVVDQITGQPLAGAVVEMERSGRRAVADAEGRFSFGKLRTGARTFSVTHLGYQELVQPVEVTAVAGPLTFHLTPDPVLLEGITVKMDLLERRRNQVPYASWVYDRGEVARSTVPTMREFLESYAGVRPVPCGGWGSAAASSFSGECVYSRGRPTKVSVYIDESPVFGLESLALFRPSEVARVEVYRGGRHIRMYTAWFMEQVALGKRPLSPVL